jgi:hypothetical protein
MLSLQVTFASPDEYQAVHDAEIAKGGLLVRGATIANAPPGAEVSLTIAVTGGSTATVSARLAAVIPGVGVAVMFSPVPPELATLGEAAEDEAPAFTPLSERMKKLTVTEKMQLALSGTRDERLAIFRDTNKTLHLFALKNPRIGLDEVQTAAKSANTSPDALKYIAEHREWGGNTVVCASLVRNPKTPMPLALRALDKITMSDLKAIAKGGARDQLVHAARKKLANP